MTLPFRESRLVTIRQLSIPGKIGARFWWRDALPHTNQLGLGKRRWDLVNLFSGSWISGLVTFNHATDNHTTFFHRHLITWTFSHRTVNHESVNHADRWSPGHFITKHLVVVPLWYICDNPNPNPNPNYYPNPIPNPNPNPNSNPKPKPWNFNLNP